MGGNRTKTAMRAAGAVAALFLAAGCASPEQRLERYLKSGSELLEDGKLGQANVQFLNALKIDEDNVPALQGLASIAEKKADYQQMFGILQKITRIDPSNERAKLDLAKLHLLGNDAKSALDLLDPVLAASPQNAEAMAVKAAVMFRLQNTAQALELANAALAIDPNSQEAIAVLASERVLAKDFDGALKILDDAVARSPKSAVLHLLRVQVLSEMGRADDINAAYQALIKQYPDDANYRRLYATSLIAQNKLEEARAELVETARILPRQLDAKLDVARIDFRVGGKAKTEATLRKFIAESEEETDLQLALGAFLREQKDYDGADKVYHEILRRKGVSLKDILRAKNEMAALYMLKGDRPQAEKLIAEILSADDNNPDALVKRAGLRLDDGDVEEAIGDLRIAADEDPESAPAKLLLAAAFEQQGDLKLAESTMAEAVERSGRAAQPSFLFAKYLLRHGKPERAEQTLAESLAAHPDSEDNLKLLAAIRLDKQNWRGAEEAATALRAVDKTDQDIGRILAAAYAGLEDYAGAIDVLTKENERAPLAARPLATLIQAYVDAGRIADAESFLTNAIAKNPSHYDARVLLAQVQRATQKSAEAVASLRAAIALDPLRPDAYEALYGLHIIEGRREEAGAVIEQALGAIPDNDGLQVLKADHLIATKRPDAAIAIYETILTRRPNDLIVANNLASLLLEREDEASVARAVKAAEALKDADNPYLLDTYGWAMYRGGRIKDGIEALQQAVEKAPGLVDARYHLGIALIETGETERGAEELQAVIDAPGADIERVADARRRIGK